MCYRIYKGHYQSAEEMAIHVHGCIKQYLILERALEGKEHLVSKTIQEAAALYTCLWLYKAVPDPRKSSGGKGTLSK